MPLAQDYSNAGTSPYETSVLAFRSNPAMKTFVEKNYLDEDLEQAVSRYARSAEFGRVLRLLRGSIGSTGQILDAGAGRGLSSLALAASGYGVTSVDYDDSEAVGIVALGRASRMTPTPVRPLRGDVLRLPFRDRTFDAVFCRSLLHHLDDLGGGLKEMHRVVRPGGVLIVCNEHILPALSDGRKFLEHHPAVPYGVNEHAYPTHLYLRELSKAGFRHRHLFGDPLDFDEYLASSQRGGMRKRLVQLPVAGRVCARILHGMHVASRAYLFVHEEHQPVISIFARRARTES